jgi:hypothetical protein
MPGLRNWGQTHLGCGVWTPKGRTQDRTSLRPVAYPRWNILLCCCVMSVAPVRSNVVSQVGNPEASSFWCGRIFGRSHTVPSAPREGRRGRAQNRTRVAGRSSRRRQLSCTRGAKCKAKPPEPCRPRTVTQNHGGSLYPSSGSLNKHDAALDVVRR